MTRRMMRELRGILSVGSLAVASLLPHHASAQAAPKVNPAGRWGLSLAASHQGVNDEIASPLRQAGFGPAVGLQYRSRGRRSDWGIGTTYGHRSLAPAPGAGRNSSESVQDLVLEVAYLRRVSGDEAARFAAWAGVGSKIRVVARIHHYGMVGSETYADGFAPLEAQGMWTFAANRAGTLSGRLAVAVLSVVARDPYTGAKYAPEVEVMSPVRAPMLRHILSYRFRMGSSFDGVLAHELSYVRYPEPRRMVMATQDLRFTLEWKR